MIHDSVSRFCISFWLKSLTLTILLTVPSPSFAAKARLPEHLATPNLATALTPFSLSEGGLSFSYPSSWTQAKLEDKDEIVKLECHRDGHYIGEIKVAKIAGFEGIESLETHKIFVEQLVFSKLDSYKQLQSKKVFIGYGRNIPAELVDISFTYGGIPVKQRWVFTHVSNRGLTFLLSSPSENFMGLIPYFSQVLLSVRGEKTAFVSRSSQGKTKPQVTSTSCDTFSPLRLNKPAMTFSYPSSWHVVHTDSRQEPIKIENEDAKKGFASVAVYFDNKEEDASLEEIVDIVEKEYYSDLKNYRQVSKQPASFGHNSKLRGMVIESNFDLNSAKVKQMSVCFKHNNRIVALALNCISWSDNDMRQLFAKIIGSIELAD